MARQIIEIVDIIFTKVFLRAIILFVLLIFASDFFPWTKQLFSYIFPNPELVIEELGTQTSITSDIFVGDEQWYQRVVSIANKGNSTAHEIIISAVVPWGRITRYKVFSDYPYEVHSTTAISDGNLMLRLEQLAPNASVTIYLWGVRSRLAGDVGISFSTIYDGGSASGITKHSSSEQISEVANNVILSALYTIQFVRQNEKVRDLFTNGIPFMNIIIPTIPLYLSTIVFVIVLLSWLFLKPVQAAIIYGLMATTVYWLRVDNFYLTASTVAVIAFVYLLFFATRIGGQPTTSNVKYSDTTGAALSFLFAFVGLVLLVNSIFLHIPIHPAVDQMLSYATIGYIITVSILVVE